MFQSNLVRPSQEHDQTRGHLAVIPFLATALPPIQPVWSLFSVSVVVWGRCYVRGVRRNTIVVMAGSFLGAN